MAEAIFGVINKELLDTARSQAMQLMKETFEEARKRGQPAQGESKPPLFPNGIDMVHVKFEVSLSEAAKLAIDVHLDGVKMAKPG